jgi:threonine dehydrogenase-like Zn-dependent dehydrogenase
MKAFVYGVAAQPHDVPDDANLLTKNLAQSPVARKPDTFEVGVRVLKSRGTLVKAGVHAPGRWEWSPLYFKEISWVGSNAFGVEEVDGKRKHAIAHYLDLVSDGRINLGPMLTHTFRLD